MGVVVLSLFAGHNGQALIPDPPVIVLSGRVFGPNLMLLRGKMMTVAGVQAGREEHVIGEGIW
jgi:hypothetical protein